MKKLSLLTLFIFFININFTSAQDVITLRNASFDWDRPIANAIPGAWMTCGNEHETPPDIHSKNTRHYKVNHQPKHGRNYIGLVVRSNFTYESIYQYLKQPLLKDKQYQMEMYVAMSETFRSSDALTGKSALFNQPAVIRIWGIGSKCETLELLYESEPINNTEWKKLTMDFAPKITHEFFMIEAFYDRMIDDPYNGNVLLDGLSEIIEN